MKICRVVRHVPHEGLGTLARPLADAGFEIRFHDAWSESRVTRDEAVDAALLIVMGGPMGAYDIDRYPFLRAEIDGIAARLDREQPTFGVCLGAQLIARAAAARVYPGERFELGFDPVELTASGRESALASLADGTRVLHWHGDTFDLPHGAIRLASSSAYREQAFSIGAHAIALQFHLEIDAPQFESWIDAGADDIRRAGATPEALRVAMNENAASLATRSAEVLDLWLAGNQLR
jgi:GMP synthase (glutamine-hydrolysing)